MTDRAFQEREAEQLAPRNCKFCPGDSGPNPVMPGHDMCETCYGWCCEDRTADADAEACENMPATGETDAF